MPPSLALAEKWATETGRKTQRILSDPLPDGSRLPTLMITQGNFKILVGEQGTCVLVFVWVKVPDNVRKKLADLAPEDKQRLLITFRGELLSSSRTGFGFIPQKFDTIDQLEVFTTQQLLKISEDDVSSFNRFCDALQETLTIAVKTMSVFEVLVSTQGPSSTAVKPASDVLYG